MRCSAAGPVLSAIPIRVLGAVLSAVLTAGLGAAFCGPGVAHAAPASVETAGVPPPASAGEAAPALPTPVATAEGISEYRLPNGLRVLLAPDAAQPTTTINITYLVGSRHESYGESGMAHLLEHLLFKGTPSVPDGAIGRQMASRGMQFNGTTAHDRTNYFATFAASEENLDWLLRMEADRMVNSTISRSALDSEMTVVRNELERGENSPTGVLLRQLAASAYHWHNYGKAPIGARSDIEHVGIDALQAFYRRYYQPDNAVLVITGQFDPARTLASVSRYFGAIPRPNRVLAEQYTVEPPQEGPREILLQRPGDIQVVAAQYHIGPGAHPDTAAMTLLVDILTAIPGGRLYRGLVEQKKAASQTGFLRALKQPGSVVFLAQVGKAQSLEPARTGLLELVEGIAAQPITQEELDRAQRRARNGYERMLNDPASYGVALSEAIAKGDWRLMLITRDQIERVTVDDVNRVARHYLQRTNRTLGQFIPVDVPSYVAIPPAPDLAELTRGYRGKPGNAPVAPFAPTPANIEAHTLRATLPNGMVMAMLPKPTRGARVHGQLVLRMGDVDSLRGLDAVGTLTAGMLMRGAGGRDRQQLIDAFEALRTTVGVSGDAERVTVSFQAPREHLPQVLTLLRDVLREPTLPAAEFEVLRTTAVAGIQSQVRQPEALAPVVLGRHGNPYPKGDPRYVPTLEESIAELRAVQLEQLRDFHRRFYGASHAQFALVGDFDAEAARQQVQALFGDWSAPMPFARVERDFLPLHPASLAVPTPHKANASFIAALPIGMTMDHPDYAALAIANRIFGGSSMKSRLADRLRQQEGISYGATSYLRIGALDTAGRFGIQASFAPQNLPRLKAGVQRELRRFLREGVTEEELAEARSGLRQQGVVTRSRDEALVSMLAYQLFVGQTMAFTEELERRIDQTTVEQVNAAIRRYLDPDRFVEVYAGAWPDAGGAGDPGKAAATPEGGQ
ncbi:M16 family metallopeptidase [Cupriavidus cauae]|uniref:M16 family metallopeptidase n=1 Tax=Cupriavidus cauae TaxID=2608999 RepID=UPI001CC1E020|nr:pitrilysin family protein [Cupriavidus cauae]